MIEVLEDITLKQIAAYIAAVVAIFGVFVEITPIKFNPISSFLNWIGKRLNKDLSDKVDKQAADLEKFKAEMETAMSETRRQFTEHEKNNDMHEMRRMREEIFDFSNQCQNGHKHTRRQFEHIFDLYDDYESLIDKWELTNGQVDIEIAYIREKDLEYKRENCYLPDTGIPAGWDC